MVAAKKTPLAAGAQASTSLSSSISTSTKTKPVVKKITDFQRKVYAMTRLIPNGKVTTYRNLAIALSEDGKSSKLSRAVGNALRYNPFAPMVPCHRVIKSDGTIGGFSGGFGADNCLVQQKHTLLEKEGLVFEQQVKNEMSLLTCKQYRSKNVIALPCHQKFTGNRVEGCGGGGNSLWLGSHVFLVCWHLTVPSLSIRSFGSSFLGFLSRFFVLYSSFCSANAFRLSLVGSPASEITKQRN